ncbi:MAG: gliding motility-associated C-terminal domain-containing protein [Prevotella sp.]|jgi:gliding motility-associated-like protein|nr:gliding motility-associated C-terminal domain-containing protein [Prevotella sp.]
MKKNLIFLLFTFFLGVTAAFSQKVEPKAYYTNPEGLEQITDNISDGQAPLKVIFRANPSEMDGYSPSYEWHFRRQPKNGTQEELFVRYEEDTEYTFTESGDYKIMLKTRLEQDGAELDSTTVSVTILESRLKFPNAFSPNDDGTNDKYGAYGVNDENSPDHWRSIVKFHAIIINRRGQKLYEWYDPAGYWDGTYNGHPVKEGVYYVVVSAKGAEGHEYNIRKDVNLLRTHGDEEGQTTTEE